MARRSNDTKKKYKPKATGQKPTARSAQRKQDDKPKALLPLTWQATEPERRPRWWWYAGIAIVGAWLTLVSAGLGEWSIALLAAVTTVTILTVHARRPRRFNYRLSAEQLMVNDRSSLDLARYRAFTLRQYPATARDQAHTVVVLIPNRRGLITREIYLTGVSATDTHITDTLVRLMPRDDSEAQPFYVRIIDKLARWLRLE